MGKICSILLILALVLSFSVVAAPVSAQPQYSEVTVNITAPLDSAKIVGGTEFTVSANVTNNGSVYAFDVRATIEISGNATLQTGEVATKDISEDLPAGNTTQVSWDLVCIGGGTVNITVTPSGKDGLTHGIIPGSHLNHDMVSIIQEQVLEVFIVEPANYDAFNVTQYFDVTAKVKNISSLNATEVELTIDIDRYAELKAGEDATQTVGILDSLDTSTNVTWTLECTGDGFSRITVSPSGKVEIEEVEEDIPDDALIPATVTVSQGDFDTASIELDEGWNLISLPLIPLKSDIEVVLAGIMEDVISVWYWAGDWYSYAPGEPSNLHFMEDGKAYWINMEAARTLNIAGTEMPEGGDLPPAYDVVVGWNMVGFKSTNNATAEAYLYGTEVARIYWFKNGTWHTIPGPDYTGDMEPGRGYWVAFTEPGTIYP